ncbi:transcriptional regulator, TetR family [Methylobacterium sp. UNC300MFChir4.1]|uniref:TetR/AcrR family transcriptional regulator n=1 Tax=Methylobacterium sp. UNC300MFChir4.1 TaxID=1502747 RepID=UPI0008B6F51D|nr:TetR/AcrR family transcriptional regulator [Methylobacterium sp. UNC300MFChir4.1]SEP28009.1 transcriptional regulator, TetR family [Methylobacterium sp. UNC300MFChir4.1]
MVMGRPRSFDTDKALDEAMEVFWRHGYDGASLAMLTKAMGIKPPSLYAAFGSKEGLLKAALDRYAQRRSEHMRFVLAGETARDVAERFLSSIAESHTDPANPPGCLLVQGGLACGAGSENIPFELASRRAQGEMELRERFIRARQDGDLPADSDPVALARFLSTVASGMGVLASSGADREALREVARVSLRAFAREHDA